MRHNLEHEIVFVAKANNCRMDFISKENSTIADIDSEECLYNYRNLVLS